MNRSLCSALIAVVVGAGSAGAHAQDVGVSISAPGIYGRLDLGGYPQPQVVYPQPVIIDRGPPAEPVYLHVPPGQERQWRRYCRQYDACGRPVFFVRDDWYRNTYAPRYREAHGRDDHRGPPDGGHRGDDRDRGDPGDRGRGDPGDRGRGDPGDRGRGDPGDRGRHEGNDRGGRD